MPTTKDDVKDEAPPLPEAREDLLVQAGQIWDSLRRTKKERAKDVVQIALVLENTHLNVIRAISDFVSMHAINVAKSTPANGEQAARQGLLVRALAEVANKILALEIKREVVKDDGDTPKADAGKEFSELD